MSTLLRLTITTSALAVAVVAVVTGVVGVAGVGTAAPAAPPARETAVAPVAPGGHRLVGLGRVALVVPEEWTVTAVDSSSRRGRAFAGWATDPVGVAGVEVLSGRLGCSPLAECLFDPRSAPVLVVVPAEGLVVVLSGRSPDPADLSVVTLPAGWTGVPFVPGRGSTFAWARAIGSAGLVPHVHDVCDDLGLCVGPSAPVRYVHPPSGTVLEVGSRVDVGWPSG